MLDDKEKSLRKLFDKWGDIIAICVQVGAERWMFTEEETSSHTVSESKETKFGIGAMMTSIGGFGMAAHKAKEDERFKHTRSTYLKSKIIGGTSSADEAHLDEWIKSIDENKRKAFSSLPCVRSNNLHPKLATGPLSSGIKSRLSRIFSLRSTSGTFPEFFHRAHLWKDGG